MRIFIGIIEGLNMRKIYGDDEDDLDEEEPEEDDEEWEDEEWDSEDSSLQRF